LQLQQLAIRCESGIYKAPQPELASPLTRKLTNREAMELKEFLAERFPDLHALRLKAEIVAATIYKDCKLPYVSYTASALRHDDVNLASAASRGSLVSVEFQESDGVHSCWFGIVRFFAMFTLHKNQPPCVVAYVDYFRRWRPYCASPVQRLPLSEETSRRVVAVDEIVGKVLLLPASSSPLIWYVVDGIKNE
jgi:hypothetical protein